MVIDIHCHYTFTAKPVEAGRRMLFETGERMPFEFDSCVSPRAAGRMTWRMLQRLAGIDTRLRPGERLDAALAGFYREHLSSPAEAASGGLEVGVSARQSTIGGMPWAGDVEKIVLLAFDAYHDDEGRVTALPARRGDVGSDIYTSNSLVREACEKGGGRFLFGASVHPYRRGAPECVEEAYEGGACLLKWIPLHQNIDIGDRRTVEVLRCCAKIGLPLLLHYGEEFTLATQHREYRDVAGLLEVLRGLRRRGAMPTVIVAHVATPVWPGGETRDYEVMLEALRGEFADEPLYADISALTAWGKVRYLRELARRPELHRKLLFGSDFPVPPATWRLKRDLGRAYGEVAACASWPNQILRVSRLVGFSEIVFQRAGRLLPNVRAFDRGGDAPKATELQEFRTGR